MNDIAQDFRKLIDKMTSGRIRPDLLSVLKTAKVQGIAIDMEQIRSFVEQKRRATGKFICPKFIPEFIAS